MNISHSIGPSTDLHLHYTGVKQNVPDCHRVVYTPPDATPAVAPSVDAAPVATAPVAVSTFAIHNTLMAGNVINMQLSLELADNVTTQDSIRMVAGDTTKLKLSYDSEAQGPKLVPDKDGELCVVLPTRGRDVKGITSVKLLVVPIELAELELDNTIPVSHVVRELEDILKTASAAQRYIENKRADAKFGSEKFDDSAYSMYVDSVVMAINKSGLVDQSRGYMEYIARSLSTVMPRRK